MPKQKAIEMDRFYSQSAFGVAQDAFKILSDLHGNPERLLASTACLFLLGCERYQIRPQRALDAAGRMLQDAAYADRGGHYDAIRRTLEDESMPDGYRKG
jgi:hypothetical protein|tara:strand:- start:467 stop:766 length:300 start_codon:yes stop_codon:yes gene_type:complete